MESRMTERGEAVTALGAPLNPPSTRPRYQPLARAVYDAFGVTGGSWPTEDELFDER